ncbi:nuclear transport factor 2 family protein [Mycobacterium sp.]|uniref:nuclear transport factor 2 family protein n=1 Tax=Mycobacterium sp. TaxID=1785 RepID=UPI003C718EAD
MANNESFQETAERIYHDWDKALSNDDVEGLLALYAPDAILESPAVPLTMGTETGVCHGHDELRPLLEQVAARKPPLRTYYRKGFLTDGERTMIFEYPRATPDGEQMDFVEVMEIVDGLIQRHCVYWGWRGVKVIQDDAYHK